MGELIISGCFNIQSYNFSLKARETFEYPFLDCTEGHTIFFSSILVDSKLVLVSSASLNNLKPVDILIPRYCIRCLLEGEYRFLVGEFYIATKFEITNPRLSFVVLPFTSLVVNSNFNILFDFFACIFAIFS